MDATAKGVTGADSAQHKNNHNNNYKKLGVCLPPLQTGAYPGSWRLAHFALAFPIPEQTEIRNLDLESADTGSASGWQPGRFNGVKRLASADGSASAQTFHRTAHSYFKGPLRDSVGVFPVDGEVINESGSAYSDKKVDVKSWKYVYVKDYYGDDEKEYPEGSVWSFAGGAGKLTLAALEYIRYLDPEQSIICQNEKEYVATERNNTRVVVLHLLGEYLTPRQLQKVSSALNKPNRKLYGASLQNGGKATDDAIYPLWVLAREVREKLGVKDPDTLVMSNGGYFMVSPEKRASRESADDGYDIVRPVHTVCALPEAPKITPPDIENVGPDYPDTQWAWQLATLADDFYSGVPDFLRLDEPEIQRSNSWTAGFSANGMALVRTTPIGRYDMEYMMTTGTRYIDLVLLVRRAGRYLDRLSRQLRKLRFEEYETSKATHEARIDDLEDANRELVRNLESFQALQRDFIVFRDYLWFDSVSGKPRDTEILRGILRATGVWQQYADVADEMKLRREFYDMREGNLRLQLDKIRRQKEESEAERKANNDKILTYLLGIGALFLAVVPLVQFSVGENIKAGIIIVFGVILCLSLYWGKWEKDPRKQDTHTDSAEVE